jgi:hypothetical protein
LFQVDHTFQVSWIYGILDRMSAFYQKHGCRNFRFSRKNALRPTSIRSLKKLLLFVEQKKFLDLRKPKYLNTKLRKVIKFKANFELVKSGNFPQITLIGYVKNLYICQILELIGFRFGKISCWISASQNSHSSLGEKGLTKYNTVFKGRRLWMKIPQNWLTGKYLKMIASHRHAILQTSIKN